MAMRFMPKAYKRAVSCDSLRPLVGLVAKVVALLLSFALVGISALQILAVWPTGDDTATWPDRSTIFSVRAGETGFVSDRRHTGESETFHAFTVTTHIQTFDFENETVEVRLSVTADRSWIEAHSREFPEARLRLSVWGLSEEAVIADRTAREFLANTNEDIDFDLTWEFVRKVSTFQMDPSSFPLDTLRNSFTLNIRWMQSDGRVFPDNDPPVFVAWGLELANANAGWKANATLSSHQRTELRQRLTVSIARENGRIAQAAVYALALFAVAVIVASLVVVRMRDAKSEHWEDVGALAALAIAVPTIRTLLPPPAVDVTTLLDAVFLLIFSIIISALLIRFSSFIK